MRVALEIHPGFCAHNVPTMLRLREAVEMRAPIWTRPTCSGREWTRWRCRRNTAAVSTISPRQGHLRRPDPYTAV